MHWPLEAPQEFLDMFSKVPDNARQHVCAMAKILDEGVGNITAALKSKGIYEQTIQIFSSDNGDRLTTTLIITVRRDRV